MGTRTPYPVVLHIFCPTCDHPPKLIQRIQVFVIIVLASAVVGVVRAGVAEVTVWAPPFAVRTCATLGLEKVGELLLMVLKLWAQVPVTFHPIKVLHGRRFDISVGRPWSLPSWQLWRKIPFTRITARRIILASLFKWSPLLALLSFFF